MWTAWLISKNISYNKIKETENKVKNDKLHTDYLGS